MDSSELYVIDFESSEDNHNRLLSFLACATKKYNDSRSCRRKGKGLAPKTVTLEDTIHTKTEVNASLFFNALLYYVFSESGLVTMMQDKRKRVYPSNVLSSLYRRAWTTSCTSRRKCMFKTVHQTCCTILDQSDMEFTGFIEHVVIPVYLKSCADRAMPSYNPDEGTYTQDSKNTILSWAIRYWNALLLPGKTEDIAYSVRQMQASLITQLKDEELPTTSDSATPVLAKATKEDSSEEAAPVLASEPAVAAMEQVTFSMPTPQQLVDGYISLHVQLADVWDEEAKNQMEKHIATIQASIDELSKKIDDLTRTQSILEAQQALLRGTISFFSASAKEKNTTN